MVFPLNGKTVSREKVPLCHCKDTTFLIYMQIFRVKNVNRCYIIIKQITKKYLNQIKIYKMFGGFNIFLYLCNRFHAGKGIMSCNQGGIDIINGVY